MKCEDIYDIIKYEEMSAYYALPSIWADFAIEPAQHYLKCRVYVVLGIRNQSRRDVTSEMSQRADHLLHIKVSSR